VIWLLVPLTFGRCCRGLNCVQTGITATQRHTACCVLSRWSFRGGTRDIAVSVHSENAYEWRSHTRKHTNSVLGSLNFIEIYVQPDSFLSFTHNRNRLRPVLRPGPRWRSSRTTLPIGLVGWEGDTRSRFPTPSTPLASCLCACGASRSCTPWAKF